MFTAQFLLWKYCAYYPAYYYVNILWTEIMILQPVPIEICGKEQ